jgi:hypothetical protein
MTFACCFFVLRCLTCILAHSFDVQWHVILQAVLALADYVALFLRPLGERVQPRRRGQIRRAGTASGQVPPGS